MALPSAWRSGSARMQTGPAATAISNTHAAARMLLPLQLFRKELVKSNYT